jgi:transcriptional regulator with XRE-family HTH domain
MDCGEKIAFLRKTNNMTQAELGDSLNVTYQAVSKWERGESHPDYETISKIAKLYGVPITYFEEGGENEVTIAQTSTQVLTQSQTESEPEQPKTIGVCTCCGRMLVEGEEVQGEEKLICQPCYDKQKKEEEEKAKQARIAAEKAKREAERKKQEEENKQRLAAAMAQKQIRRRRNRGLIIAIFPAVIALIILISKCVKYGTTYSWLIPLTILLPIFLYTYVAQLFWDGAVLWMSLCGIRLTRMPGVIFSFDWDGLKFLIIVKLIFAAIKIIVFLVTWGVCVAAAILISPFTFFPSMARVNRGDL